MNKSTGNEDAKSVRDSTGNEGAESVREVIAAYRTHESDTGSPEVQVALLSRRIAHLTQHFQRHAGDHHSRRGLLKLVSKRRRLLKYLRGIAPERYQALIARLGLRR